MIVHKMYQDGTQVFKQVLVLKIMHLQCISTDFTVAINKMQSLH